MIGTWGIPLTAGEAEVLDPAKVTPGMGGFLVFFLLALASWALYRSFATHMRRVDVRARRDTEAQAGQPAGSGPDAPEVRSDRQERGASTGARTEPGDAAGEAR